MTSHNLPIVLDLSRWSIIGLHLEEPFSDEPTLYVRFKHASEGRYQVVVFRGVSGTLESGSLLNNIHLTIVSTAPRGWDRTRRYEITDLDEGGPYFWAVGYDVVETDDWNLPIV